MVATTALVASSSGAVVSYSTSNTSSISTRTEALEKEDNKIDNPLVWASFKDKGNSGSNSENVNPLDWF
ncbi:hypothetical protein A6V39_04995 [Candidatus Mycoplasma haematobovis]|uniref:Uncharacterized protein n=2 Tax=Candidatus Mycoplasma haematobovis TaxID=432608 RepID=A0A1A9QCG6_9MOLU|nr:hypothetical protein A6V39_04995 [Candidatus Mycoplasma haematobovis]